MSGEKILTVGDSLEGPTGFATNSSSIAFMLAKDYEVHHLGLQSVREGQLQLNYCGETREVTEHPNLPRSGDKWDFGRKSLPVLLNKLNPDILLTVNDIQMIQHVPDILYPSTVNIKLMDLPSKKLVSRDALIMELESHIQRFKERYPLDTKWIAYCFVPNTEVLTPDGIKNIQDFEVGDKVYTLNPITKNIEISNVIKTHKRYYNGNLVHINHQRVQMKVTPEHIMYLNGKEMTAQSLLDMKKWAIRKFPIFKPLKAKSIKEINLLDLFPDSMIIRISKKNDNSKLNEIKEFGKWKDGHSNNERYLWKYKSEIRNDKESELLLGLTKTYAKSRKTLIERIPLKMKWSHFLKLVGWYISEGSTDYSKSGYSNGKTKGSKRFSICQKNSKGRKTIKKLLEDITFEYNVSKDSIDITSEFLYDFFRKQCGHNVYEKRIPKWIFNYSNLEPLYESAMMGDGHINEDNNIRHYYTTSDELSNDMTQLGFLIGMKANRTISKDSKGLRNVNGNLYECKESKTIIYSKYKIAPVLYKKDIKEIPYEGYVYDITTDNNHLIFAGLDGKFGVTHQCPQDGIGGLPQWKNIYSMADKVIAFSKFGKKVFRDSWNMDVPYIYHAIDTDLFQPQERKDFKDKFVVGNMNRNQPRKQPVRTIMAFAKFAKGKEDVLLHMQMDWNDQFGWPLQYFGGRYGCLNKMIRPAPVGIPKEQIAHIYNQWDLSVNTTGGEGFGLCDVESQSCGVPQISSDYTTPRELIIDGKPSPRGALIPTKELYWEKMDVAAVPRSAADIDELAKIFDMYYHNRELIDIHGKNGREWITKHCSMKVLQDKWIRTVKDVLNQ